MNFETIIAYIKAAPLFTVATTALGSALIDVLAQYATQGSLDLSSAGLEKLGAFVLSSVAAAVVHYYRPSPAQSAKAKENK